MHPDGIEIRKLVVYQGSLKNTGSHLVGFLLTYKWIQDLFPHIPGILVIVDGSHTIHEFTCTIITYYSGNLIIILCCQHKLFVMTT